MNSQDPRSAGPPETPLVRHSTSPARAVATLAAIAAIVGFIVGAAWYATRDRIAENDERKVRETLLAVLPADHFDNRPEVDTVWRDLGEGPVPVYRARLNGEPSAAVLSAVAPDGYSGTIRLLVAVDISGRLLGVRVTSHSETPGIGDAIDASKSDWITRFAGRSLGDLPESSWSLRQDGGEFDAIAGATISSRAVVGAVRRTVHYFATHRDALFAAPVETAPPQ